MTNPESDDLARELLASAAMKETAEYLSRGRTFERLSDSEAESAWVEAFKAWVADRSTDNQRVMDDLAAELGLREIALPQDRVAHEVTALSAELKAEFEQNGAPDGLLDEIAQFLLDREQQRN